MNTQMIPNHLHNKDVNIKEQIAMMHEPISEM